MLFEVGKQASMSLTFDHPPDSVSLGAKPPFVDGLAYCRGRTYSFNAATDLTSNHHSSPVSLNVVLVDRTLTVTTSDVAEYGYYEANIQITLDEYPTFPGESHYMDIKVIPQCSQTDWDSPAPPVVNDMSIAVNEDPQT